MKRFKVLYTTLLLLFIAVMVIGCGNSTQETTTTQMVLFESTEHGFSIEYPEDWVDSINEMDTQFSFEFLEPQGSLSASVFLEYRCQEIDRTTFVSDSKSYLQSLPKYQLISERNLTINGESAYEVTATGEMNAGTNEKFRFMILTHGKQGFWVGVRGEPSSFNQQEQMIDTILDSFKLLSSYTYLAPEPWLGGEYSSSGFSIAIPEGWCQFPVSRPSHIVCFAPSERDLSIHIAIEQRPEDVSLTEYIDNVIEGMPEYWLSFNLISKRELTLSGGVPAGELVFTGNSDLSPAYTSKCKYLVVITEERAFWVMAASNPSQYSSHLPIIDEILNSFRLH